MSSYLEVYAKINDTLYVPLGEYSRSSSVYKVMQDYVPYGKVSPINTTTIGRCINDLDNSIQVDEKTKANLLESKKDIYQFVGNSVEDKLEALHDIDVSIREIDESIEDSKFARDYMLFLQNMISDIVYLPENIKENINPNTYLFGGVEVECKDGIPTEN